ncbi:hypothetical protein ElyMa_003540500 [Elysia marginata]|uniref:Uncharacterized protein n=1 Tax=Elysia marginata TaxID=1093978 RepID=A0AAV4EJ17_9GAST|nr:hypothetical protein ElyMa_003540500 [Elysia marginata]
MSVIGSSREPLRVFFIEILKKVRFYHLFKRGAGKRHVQRVRVHLTELIIFSGHELVHKVMVELQHAQFCILIDKKANWQWQVPSDFVFSAFHLKQIIVIERSTSPEEAVVNDLSNILAPGIDNIASVL